MTIGAGITIAGRNLSVFRRTILSDVHDNIILTPYSSDHVPSALSDLSDPQYYDNSFAGAFIGVDSDHTGSRRVFPIGKLQGLRFMCVFRFKMWWMTQRMGKCGQDIPFETQFMIVEANGAAPSGETAINRAHSSSDPLYTVFLPILEGDFRAVLQGNANDELEICLESGCPSVEGFEGSHLVYVAAGSDPFDVINNAVKTIESHLQTFSHRERKQMPDVELVWMVHVGCILHRSHG